jgi:DNA mismatch endonuclease (patch repair protein)
MARTSRSKERPLPRRPPAVSADVRRRMQATARRDTPCEMAIRSAIHRLGLRYVIDRSPIRQTRRRADLLFRTARVAVFVDGCFWHGCPTHGTWPKSNAVWWRAKIEKNRERDLHTDVSLRAEGWAVARIWAHQDPLHAAKRIVRLVRQRRSEAAREPRTPKR